LPCWQGICFLWFEFPRSTVHHGKRLKKIRFQTAGNDRNCVEAIKGSAMSKRLFIWIGLIILVGVISAAGWSVFVTVNRPVTEAPPPPVRGKIPQIPQTASVNTIHRSKIPPPPAAQPQATMTAAKEETPTADTQTAPAPQAQEVDPAPTPQSTEQTPMTPQELPAPEPVEQDAVETPADRSDAQDSKAPPAPEPPPAQPETTVEPAAESEPENQTAQQDTPDPMSKKEPAQSEQSSAPSASEPKPEAKQAAKPKPSADPQFTIQVGAYRNKNYAESAMERLSRKGYEAYIFKDTDAKSRAWHLVRIGHFPTRQAAQWALSAYQDKEQKKALITREGVR
jgi:cell division septation protein DedD